MKLFTLVLLFVVTSASAQWSNTTNLFYDSLHMAVCTAPQIQNYSFAVRSYPDSGYFIIWTDSRNNGLTAIYAQKYDKSGHPLWAANGIPVSASPNNDHYTYQGQNYRSRSCAATDGSGGLYITYADDSSASSTYERVCLQHVKSDGTRVFAGPGNIVASSVTANQVTGPQLIADDNGGCYIAFSGTPNLIHAFDFKDVNGTIQNLGGGIMNQYAQQVTATSACGNYTYLNYPDATVWDYNIFSDLQGGCNIVMNLSGVGLGVTLAYNKLWRAKQNATVTQHYRDLDYSVKTETIDFRQDSVYRLYYLRTDQQDISCGSGTTVYTVTQYRLIQQGFQIIDQGALVYSLDMPKGVTIPTSTTINTTFLLGVERADTASSGVSDPIAKIYDLKEEIFDSIPYQRTSFMSPDYPGYNLAEPPYLSKLNIFMDTALAAYKGRTFEASLAGGGNQVYTAALIEDGNLSAGYRYARLNHLAVENAGADSFAVVYKTDQKKGVIIGEDQQNYFTGGQYDLPLLSVDHAGNALFYIKESDGSSGPVRVSPIFNGAQLAWGAMGKAIGTGYTSAGIYNMVSPTAVLDPYSGTGLIAWIDSRNFPASNYDIYIRHLDSLNIPGYQPPYRRLRAFPDPYGPVTTTMALFGSSNSFTTFEALAPTGDVGVSPTAAISDNYNLGNVTVNTYENTSGIRTYNGAPYLDRSWTITPDNNPNGSATVSIRLFFTTDEFNALQAADPSIKTPGDLAVIKQPSGSGSGSTYSVVAGEKTVIPQAWAAVDGGYYIEIQVTSFSNFFIVKNANPLPLNWLGVRAQWQNGTQAEVSWQVADQQNVKTYTVQHSTDGTTFTDGCTQSAETTETQYSCITEAEAGKNYYRVMETDLDGMHNYSKVVTLDGSQPELTMYPNPAKDVLYIDGLTGYKLIQLADAGGKVLQRQTVISSRQQVNISALAPGIYTLTLTGNSDFKTIRFIKY